MKVLHVIPSLSLVHGGPSHVIRVMEQALAAEGIVVHTATTDDDGPNRRLARPLGVLLEEEGAMRWYFRKDTEFYTCSISFASWILRHARDYDLIQVHALFSFTSTVAALAARRAGVPYVVHPLGTLNRYGIEQRRPLLKRASLSLIEGPIIRRAAAVHFTSEAERAEAELLGYGTRKFVIPLGLNLIAKNRLSLQAQLPETRGKRVVTFISRLDPKKNVEGLLSGFASLAKEVDDLHLVVAGGGERAYVSALKGQAKELGLTANISWPGLVSGDLKAALLYDAAVFVLPSYSESFGLAAAEALAAGLPCVVGEGVALAREIRTAGAGVEVTVDPQSIAAGLRRVLGDEGERLRMSRSARELADYAYSATVMGRRMRRMYESVLMDEGG